MPRRTSPKLAPACFIAPMKALGSTAIPTGRWQCEIKFDGYRAVAVLNEGKVDLWSRNHKPLLESFPEIGDELKALRCHNAVLDGEIVMLDSDGRSRFQLLQNSGRGGPDRTLVYYLFDIMYRDGASLVNLPLRERRRVLESLAGRLKKRVQLSPAFEVEPAELFSAARKNGLEGIVAKAPDSRYEPDRRSGAWVKCKVLAEQEFVIGAFTPPRRSRHFFGALLVGHFKGNKLLYAGKVGTGFDEAMLGALHAKFIRQRSARCPFADLPMTRRSRFGSGMSLTEMSKVTWLKPTLVAEIKFAEWTDEGLLRQPVFLGLRQDKRPKDVHREVGPITGNPAGRPAGSRAHRG